MGRSVRHYVLLVAAAAVAAGIAVQAPRAQSRVYAATKDRELVAELPAGNGWCKQDVTFHVRGQDDALFTTGETNAEGHQGRFLLNRLLAAVRKGLEAECPQAKSVTFDGFVDDVFVYRGYANRDNSEAAWVLLDIPVALVEVPPQALPEAAPPTTAAATAAPIVAAAPEPPPRREAVGECDALAAHPDDPGKPKGIAGVADDAVNAGAALRACDEAVRAAPNNPRLIFQLARTSLLYDRHVEGVELMTDAAEAGHGGAMAALGDFALYGVLDEEADPETAKSLYLKAAKAGFKPAAKLAADIVANPKEDKSAPPPQEPEYHQPEGVALLMKAEALPMQGLYFARTMVYGLNFVAGMKHQCPDANLNGISPAAFARVVASRMGGGSLNALAGMFMMADGNFPDLEQAGMDDGYALAFTKGCASREVANALTTMRRTIQ